MRSVQTHQLRQSQCPVGIWYCFRSLGHLHVNNSAGSILITCIVSYIVMINIEYSISLIVNDRLTYRYITAANNVKKLSLSVPEVHNSLLVNLVQKLPKSVNNCESHSKKFTCTVFMDQNVFEVCIIGHIRKVLKSVHLCLHFQTAVPKVKRDARQQFAVT